MTCQPCRRICRGTAWATLPRVAGGADDRDRRGLPQDRFWRSLHGQLADGRFPCGPRPCRGRGPASISDSTACSGQHARLREHDYAVANRHDRRDRPDLELRGQVRLGLGVDLAEGDIGVRLGDLLVGRCEPLTRPAPLGPEVDQHDAVAWQRRRRWPWSDALVAIRVLLIALMGCQMVADPRSCNQTTLALHSPPRAPRHTGTALRSPFLRSDVRTWTDRCSSSTATARSARPAPDSSSAGFPPQPAFWPGNSRISTVSGSPRATRRARCSGSTAAGWRPGRRRFHIFYEMPARSGDRSAGRSPHRRCPRWPGRSTAGSRAIGTGCPVVRRPARCRRPTASVGRLKVTASRHST